MRDRDDKGRFASDSEPNSINLTIRISESLNNRLKAISDSRKKAELIRQAILKELEEYEQTAC
jgi:predicted DNA-binding protein